LASEFASRVKAKEDAAEYVKSDDDGSESEQDAEVSFDDTRAERTRRFCANMLDENGNLVTPTWMTVPWPDRPSGPRYRVGEHVYYWTGPPRLAYERGRIVHVAIPGQHTPGHGTNITDRNYYQITPMIPMVGIVGEDQHQLAYASESNVRDVDWARPCLVVSSSSTLHSMDHVGIDTCSAMSVSTEIADFTYIDSSQAAQDSISLRGVGGEQASVGGRGPIMISTRDSNGNLVYVVDPHGVYLLGSDTQFRLRILGQQRMKSFGFHLVQNKNKDGEDFLVYPSKGAREEDRLKETCIPLETVDNILMLRTEPIYIEDHDWSEIDKHIVSLKRNREKGEFLFTFEPKNGIRPLLMVNEAELSLV